MEIKHGMPKSDFFTIAVPYNGRPISEYVSIQDVPLKKITLKDPRTGKAIVAEIHDMWRLKTDEDGHLINSFSKLTYGITGNKLVRHMKDTYPNFSKHLIIDFLLLKKL